MGSKSGWGVLVCLGAALPLYSQSQSVTFTLDHSAVYDFNTPGQGETQTAKTQQISVSAFTVTLTDTYQGHTATATITFTPPSGTVTGRVATVGGPGTSQYYVFDPPAKFQIDIQGSPLPSINLKDAVDSNYDCNLTKGGTCTLYETYISTPADRGETNPNGPLYLEFLCDYSWGNIFNGDFQAYYNFSIQATNFIGIYNNGLVSPDQSATLYPAYNDPDEMPTFLASIGYQFATGSVGEITLSLQDSAGNVIGQSELCFKTDDGYRKPTGGLVKCIVGPTGSNIGVVYSVLRPADIIAKYPTPDALPSGTSKLQLVATLTPDQGDTEKTYITYNLAPRPAIDMQLTDPSGTAFVPDVPRQYLLVPHTSTEYRLNQDPASVRVSYTSADPNESATVLMKTRMIATSASGGTVGPIYPALIAEFPDLGANKVAPQTRVVRNTFPGFAYNLGGCAASGHLYPWIKVRSGQILKGAGLELSTECLSIQAPPQSIPDSSANVPLTIVWSYGDPRTLQRTVEYIGTDSSNRKVDTKDPITNVSLSSSIGSMSDPVPLRLAAAKQNGVTINQIVVTYEFVDPSGSDLTTASAVQTIGVTHGVVAPAGSGTITVAKATIAYNSTKDESTDEEFSAFDANAAFGPAALLFLDHGLAKRPNVGQVANLRRDAIPPGLGGQQPHASAALPPFILMNGVWQFGAGIPRDGSFSATLTLFYDPANFPDDPNFDPKKLEMISYDPSTGLIARLPSTVDNIGQTVSAPVDWLAPYYALAVFGPFSRKTLGAPVLDGGGLSLVNPAAAADAAELDTYDPALAQTPLSLAAGQQTASAASQLIPAAASGSWLLARTATNTSGVQLLSNGVGFETPDMPAAPSAYSVFPTALFTTDVTTSFEVVNPNLWDGLVQLALYGSDGSQPATTLFPLPAKSKVTLPFAAAFAGVQQPFSGYVVLAASRPVYATAITQSALAMSAANAQPVGTPAANGLYAPFSGADAVLSLVNLDTNPASLTVRAFAADGTSAASPQTITVQPGAQYRSRLADAFGVATLPAGSLFIDGAPATMYGDLTIGDPLFLTLSSLPLVRAGRTANLIPYVANDTATQTTVAVVGAGTAANVVVTAFQPNGTVVGSASLSLAANGSSVQPLQQLISRAATLNPGYLRVDSDQPVLAYAGIAPSGTTDFGIVNAQPAPAGQPVTPPPTAPSISVNPTSLSFGNVTVGQSSTLSLTITNKGGGTLSVTGLSLPNGPFALVSPPTFPLSVPAAGTTITVKFTPTAAGAQMSAFSIASNGSSTPVPVSLSGTGVAAAATPTIKLSATNLPFGNVTVNQTSSMTLTITNSGSGTLTVSSLSALAAPFSLVSPPSTPFNVPSAGTTLTVRFSPTSATVSSATLSITSNGSTSPAQVALSGTGLASTGSGGGGSGNITLIKMEVGQYNGNASAPSLAVTDVWDTDNSTKNWIIGVTNAGSFTNPLLNINGKTVSLPVPPNSYMLYASPSDLYSHDVRLTVVWQNGATDVAYFSANSNKDQAVFPREAGSANITLTNRDANLAGSNACKVFQGSAAPGCSVQDYILLLTVAGPSGGGGGSAITASPTSLDFGSITAGQTSAPKTFTVTNNGTSAVTVTLATTAPFAVSPATLPLAANGGTGTASVTYSPTTAGASSGTVNVTVSGQSTPASTVSLTGTGTAAAGGGGGGSGNIVSLKLEPGSYNANANPPFTVASGSFIWDTDNTTKNWFLGVTNAGSSSNPLLNTNGKTVSLPVPPNSYYLYASPYTLGNDMRLTVTWSNGVTDVAYFNVGGTNAASTNWTRDGTGGSNYSLAYLNPTLSQSPCHVFQDHAMPGCSAANYIWQLTITGAGGGSGGPPPAGGGITVNPTSLDLGTVTVGQTSQPKTFTITNSGTAAATVNLTTSAPFAVSPATLTIPANGGTANASVTFSPTIVGSSGSSVYVILSGQTTPTATVALTGSGVAATSGGVQTYQLVADSGSFDQLSGFPDGTATAWFVNRLTPPSYPATLRSVQIAFLNQSNGLKVGDSITVVTASVAATSATINNLTFSKTAATVTAVNAFDSYTVTPITITSGDFVVGFYAPNPPNYYLMAEDTLSGSKQRSYISADGLNFSLIDMLGLAGNYGIRAIVDVGTSAGEISAARN
jgi:hypothetical protein